MRSLATINRGACAAPSTVDGSSYISRTFPLARRGRSASVVTCRDATSEIGSREGHMRRLGGRRSSDLIEPREDLGGVAGVVGVVEDLLEVQRARALVDREQLAQRKALIPGALGELLNHAIGLVAGDAGGDDREQHTLGEERAMRQLQVGAHPLRVDLHPFGECDRPMLEVVDQDRRVGQDHALDRGVGDVALVPQRDVLQGCLRVAAQHAREAGDLLALDRVALVRHRRGALLALAEWLLDLAYLGALQIADLGREALQPGAGEGDRAEQLGVTVTRDHLGGDVLARQSQPLKDTRLEVRARRRVGADLARHRADRRLSKGALQARGVAIGLEGEARELDPERGRLGVNAMCSSDGQRLGVFAGSCGERRHPCVGARDYHLAGRAQLQRQGGIEHVRRGESEMDPAAGLARGGGEHVDERGHVVVGHELALVYGLDGEARTADRPQLGFGRTVVSKQARQLLAGRQLDLPPRLHARLVGPQAAELWARVACAHAPRICAARSPALRGLSSPTHATGTPGGICTIERIASRPPAAVRRPERGTPITGRSVCAATAPGSAAEMPAPAMITRRPRMRAFLAYSATTSGSRWADMTRSSCRMSRSSSSRAAFSIVSMSLLEPITMPTRGASTSMSSSCAWTSDSCIGSGTSEMPGPPVGRPSCAMGSSRSPPGPSAVMRVPAAIAVRSGGRRWRALLQRRDEIVDWDRGERLVAGGAARAQLE